VVDHIIFPTCSLIPVQNSVVVFLASSARMYEVPKTWERWGPTSWNGLCLPQKHATATRTKFRRCRSMCLGVIMKIRHKSDPAFQGHSRSLEPTLEPIDRHWNRSIGCPTSYWCSVIATGISYTVSEVNGDICRKSQIFPIPCI